MSAAGRVERPAARTSVALVERLRTPARHGAEAHRVALATLTMILCLAGLVALTLARPRLAKLVRSPLSHKLADSDRVAYYLVDPDAGPSFRVGPNDRSIKLITHLMLPAATPYDPEAEFGYGIEVIVRDVAGEELWRHELNIRTRQSKSGGDRFGWRYENAFMLEDERQLTDDRMTRVRLPEASEDRLVELRLLPQTPGIEVSGLARVYVRRPRPVDDRMLRALALAPEEARDLVDHLTYSDWDQLSEDERRVKLSQVWERLAAEGEAGRDYRTLSVYETGFRLPRGFPVDERRLAVDRWQSLAINVIGPAELELHTIDGSSQLDLDVYRRGLDGQDFAYHPTDAHSRTLTIPDGIHTLFVESKRRVEVGLVVAEAEAERVWLIEAERSLRVDERGDEVLEPDRRRLEVAWVGGRWAERPRWSIAAVDDATARIFRFDVRVAAHVQSTWWPGYGPTPTLEICYLDAADQLIRCDPWTGEPTLGSPFEGLRADEAGDRWYVVSEPQTLRVIAPDEAVSIELRDPQASDALGEQDGAAPRRELDAGQRLIIRGYGYWPELETTVAEPFRSHEATRVRWRYPPLETRTWFPVRPSNYAALERALAVTELFAQVRLEPEESGGRWSGDPDLDDRYVRELLGDDGWDPGPWVTLEPRGLHRRRSVIERLEPAAGRWLARRWDASLFTQLVPDRSLLFDLGATGPGAPKLHWQVHPRLLGEVLTVVIGERRYEHVIESTRGRWRLPVTRGRERVELEFEFPRQLWTAWVDRPVLIASPPVSRRRAIHDLTDTLHFPIYKPGPEALIVNVVVYVTRQREHVELELSFDDGAPARRTGIVPRVSVPARSFVLDGDVVVERRADGDEPVELRAPTRVVDLDARRSGALDVITLQLTLGEDVVAGPHELRVKLLDGGRVWVRAFHRGVADRSKPAASWTEPSREGR